MWCIILKLIHKPFNLIFRRMYNAPLLSYVFFFTLNCSFISTPNSHKSYATLVNWRGSFHVALLYYVDDPHVHSPFLHRKLCWAADEAANPSVSEPDHVHSLPSKLSYPFAFTNCINTWPPTSHTLPQAASFYIPFFHSFGYIFL